MTINGQLEIDHRRGVIYFHSGKTGWTVLRICALGEIPKDTTFIDIHHMQCLTTSRDTRNSISTH
jgi:hypothetical protein